jgi:hypothetical protein
LTLKALVFYRRLVYNDEKGLTINSDLQIFFDDNDKANVQSVNGAPLEAVKAELIE